MTREGLRATPGGRLGAIAPVPFVGTATILVALIVFTPVLLATGPSSFAVQPVLSVYRATGSSATNFYVHGTDPNVPYLWVNLSIGAGFSWGGSCPSPLDLLRWTYANETNVGGWSLLSGANPAVVNVTVTYTQSSGRTVYAGELAFDLVSQNTSGESLLYVPCARTPSVGSGSWAVSLGMLPIDLVNYGSGGPS